MRKKYGSLVLAVISLIFINDFLIGSNVQAYSRGVKMENFGGCRGRGMGRGRFIGRKRDGSGPNPNCPRRNSNGDTELGYFRDGTGPNPDCPKKRQKESGDLE